MNVLRGEVLAIEGAECRVRAAGLEFSVPADEKAQIGKEITVCLRAERMTMQHLENNPQTSSSDPVNSQTPYFEGAIEFVTYLGASTLYLVRPNNNNSNGKNPSNPALIKILEPNVAGQALHSIGDRVRVSWTIDSVSCFFIDEI